MLQITACATQSSESLLKMWLTKCAVQQVRDLEQQLNPPSQRRPPSPEEAFHGGGLLHTTSPQERNLSYIRSIEKEKREAFEVAKVDVE